MNKYFEIHWVSFPRESQSDPLSAHEWTSVLKLATMWQFQKIRATAIKNLENMLDLVDKVIIAQRFDISAWLVPTLNALVQREEMINLSEANRLGMDWVLKLAKVREMGVTPQHRTCKHCHHTGPPRCDSCSSTDADHCGSCSKKLPNPGTITKGDYSRGICEIFGLS